MSPNRLGAFCVAGLSVGALGGWQFVKYLHGYGLFYSISPRYGWIPLALVVTGLFVWIYRAGLKDPKF